MSDSVLTITLNPAIDEFIVVNQISGQDNLTYERQLRFAGGKGVNVSRALKILNVPSTAVGFQGGINGRNFYELLKKERIKNDFIRVKGDTRINYSILSEKDNQLARLMGPASKLDAKEAEIFKKKLPAWLKNHQLIVLSGGMPSKESQPLIEELFKQANEINKPIIVDSSKEALEYALKFKPFMIKPNLNEAQMLLGNKLDSKTKIKKAIADFHKKGIQVVIISLGSQGAVASDGKQLVHIQSSKTKAVCTIGCGDALLAGFIEAYLKKEDFTLSVKRAVSCGTAAVKHLSPGKFSPKDVEILTNKVSCKSY